MKKTLLILVSLLLFVGCTKTDDDKAKELVMEWLKNNVNDPSGLVILNITPIETDSVVDYGDELDYIPKVKEITRYYNLASEAIEWGDPDLAKEYEDKAIAREKEMEQQKENFKPYVRGKVAIVNYRAKNGLGALTLDTKRFRFDNEMTEITSVD